MVHLQLICINEIFIISLVYKYINLLIYMQCVNYAGNAQLKKFTFWWLKKEKQNINPQSIYPTLDPKRVKKDTSLK